jgi:hypothetical protein
MVIITFRYDYLIFMAVKYCLTIVKLHGDFLKQKGGERYQTCADFISEIEIDIDV